MSDEQSGLAGGMANAKNALSSCLESGFSLVGFVITMAIPAAMIGIGSMYLDQCPCERFIPIYLIVGGSTAIGLQAILLIAKVCARRTESDESRRSVLLTSFTSLVSMFALAWFIAGNVWVYRTKDHFTTNDPKNSLTYCNPTLYWFAFWLITATYILAGFLLCVVPCIGCCFAGIIARRANNDA